MAGKTARVRIYDNQRRCVIEATIAPLTLFRRGFGRSKAGPFFQGKTVDGLIERGILRVIQSRGRRSYLRLSALAET